MKHGKNYVDGAKLIDRSKLYESAEALDLSLIHISEPTRH